MDSGNTAWMLTSAALVFLMTPGVAFFYGGMVRAKAVLNMLMLSAAALSVTAVVWTLWGWSIAYAGSSIGGIFGDPATGFLLKDTMVFDAGTRQYTAAGLAANGNKYPSSVDVSFQVTFAMITVALICGAIAERVKYSTWMLFVALWVTFDYAPMAHMVWNNGLLSAKGPISTAIGAAAHDFAGGTVVHINAAMAALIIVLIIGKRKGFGTQPIRPHNVPFVMLGAFLLWFGWFGFNAGSAFAANGTAGYAWMSTTAATAAAMLAWGFTERIRTGHYTAIGAASGIVAGLVAITPAADVVSRRFDRYRAHRLLRRGHWSARRQRLAPAGRAGHHRPVRDAVLRRGDRDYRVRAGEDHRLACDRSPGGRRHRSGRSGRTCL